LKRVRILETSDIELDAVTYPSESAAIIHTLSDFSNPNFIPSVQLSLPMC
jgi:hypothetical protein